MSRSRVEKVHCPNCDAENHILIWESLNTKLNPKETKQLLDGTFFVFECNQCNYKTLMDYAILYHDMENMCMIYYVGDDQIDKTIPRATFYYYLKKAAQPDKYKETKEVIAAVYHENKGRYGYRRITTELHNRNIPINHKTVQRLMRELGLVCRVRMKKYRSYKGEVGKIAPNLLNRDFKAEKPNEKWVTDVTEFSLFGEKLYLSPILDLYSRDLVSYTISDRPVLSMVTTMVEKAFDAISDNTDLILHSDQGWQYQHKQYQRMLAKKGVQQSMSRKGNCLDNAVMENFFGLLKSELLYLQEFESMEHFKLELIEYLDYYNNRRIKAKLKGLPPAIHRQQALSAA